MKIIKEIDMVKSEVKKILLSMQTLENEAQIVHILGKLDMMEEAELEKLVKEIGNTEEAIRNFFKGKIEKKHKTNKIDYPINDIFTYGITQNTIHLHILGDLHERIQRTGFSKTIHTVNLYLLDAMDTIGKLKKEGFYRFQGSEEICMISPLLIKRELEFLKDMDFEVRMFHEQELQDEQYLSNNPEAQFVQEMFGGKKNVGVATIKMNTILTPEWQEKRKQREKQFHEKGIYMDEKEEMKI